MLTFKSIRKTKNVFLTPEFQICKRHGDVESSEVEKRAQSKEQHELNDTDPIDEGKFTISHISYVCFTFYMIYVFVLNYQQCLKLYYAHFLL